MNLILKTWLITKHHKTINMNWHVLPNNDIKPHTEETTCDCNPKVLHENGDMIIVHNSYDGREGVEAVNSILSKTTPSSEGTIGDVEYWKKRCEDLLRILDIASVPRLLQIQPSLLFGEVNQEDIKWAKEKIEQLKSQPQSSTGEKSELEKLKELLKRCLPYIKEMQLDNHNEPSVGIYYDTELGSIYEQLNNL